jgi:pantothenate kinase type III
VHAEYAELKCGYEVPSQLGIDRWLQVLAVAQADDFNTLGILNKSISLQIQIRQDVTS